jgi:hypothetical protein
MKKPIVNLIIILFVFQSVTLSAQESSDFLAHERIQFIQDALTQSKTGVNVWWYGWLGAYSAGTVGFGTAFLLSNDKNMKQDMALNAATAFLGGAFQLITPINTGRDADKLAKFPEDTQEEQLLKLSLAEELLKSDAMKEKAGRSWQIHALNEAVNLTGGLITWLGFKRTVWDGVENFLISSAVTETQIWTQPTRTLKDYRNYCRKYKSGINRLVYQPQPEFFLGAFPGGVSLRIIF